MFLCSGRGRRPISWEQELECEVSGEGDDDSVLYMTWLKNGFGRVGTIPSKFLRIGWEAKRVKMMVRILTYDQVSMVLAGVQWEFVEGGTVMVTFTFLCSMCTLSPREETAWIMRFYHAIS
jgi:hypothetical protein